MTDRGEQFERIVLPALGNDFGASFGILDLYRVWLQARAIAPHARRVAVDDQRFAGFVEMRFSETGNPADRIVDIENEGVVGSSVPDNDHARPRVLIAPAKRKSIVINPGLAQVAGLAVAEGV